MAQFWILKFSKFISVKAQNVQIEFPKAKSKFACGFQADKATNSDFSVSGSCPKRRDAEPNNHKI